MCTEISAQATLVLYFRIVTVRFCEIIPEVSANFGNFRKGFGCFGDDFWVKTWRKLWRIIRIVKKWCKIVFFFYINCWFLWIFLLFCIFMNLNAIRNSKRELWAIFNEKMRTFLKTYVFSSFFKVIDWICDVANIWTVKRKFCLARKFATVRQAQNI